MRKNNYLLLIIGFMVFLGLSGCAKKEVVNLSSKGKCIVCFGDSLTYGYGADRGEDYPTIMGKMVSIRVFNAGIDGDTTAEALRRMDSDVLERNPRLVIIEFGGNDFLRKATQEETLNNIRTMIDKAQVKGAMVAIVDISSGLLLKEYQPIYARLAREKGAIFIPNVFSGIITNPRLKSDFLHPNGRGYRMVAERIYQAIKPYLNLDSATKNPS